MQINKKGINPVTAGAIGAAVTAAAGTAAVVLSDSKRRQKIGKTLNTLGKKGKEFVKNARTTLNKVDKRLKKMQKRVPKGEGRKILARAARA